jgi:hypothetical protein
MRRVGAWSGLGARVLPGVSTRSTEQADMSRDISKACAQGFEMWIVIRNAMNRGSRCPIVEANAMVERFLI